MDAIKFYEEFGINYDELHKGETVQHYASRLAAGHVVGLNGAERENFSVLYSYGSKAEEFDADNNNSNHTLYSY